MNKICIWMLALCLLGACSGKKSPGDYKAYVESLDNGLHQQKTIDKWLYDVQYKPSAYIMLGESVGAAERDAKQTAQRLEELKDMVCFNFYIRNTESEQSFLKVISKDAQEYEKWLQFMSEGMKQNFTLECNGVSYEPVVYHLEPAFGLSPFDKLVVAFEPNVTDMAANDMTLSYADKILNHGIVKFKFSTTNIKKIPVPGF